jgi:hypothetical protein
MYVHCQSDLTIVGGSCGSQSQLVMVLVLPRLLCPVAALPCSGNGGARMDVKVLGSTKAHKDFVVFCVIFRMLHVVWLGHLLCLCFGGCMYTCTCIWALCVRALVSGLYYDFFLGEAVL